MAKEGVLIDWKEWGLLLKLARIRNGYSSAAALVKDLKEKTGISLSARSIYALEEGQHVPSAENCFALELLLPEMHDPKYLDPVFKREDIKNMLGRYREHDR